MERQSGWEIKPKENQEQSPCCLGSSLILPEHGPVCLVHHWISESSKGQVMIFGVSLYVGLSTKNVIPLDGAIDI